MSSRVVEDEMSRGLRNRASDRRGERRNAAGASGRARASDLWLRLLLRLYPADFREEMGEAIAETYRDRCREAERAGGVPALAAVWLQALADSAHNGLAERLRPGIAWRRSGNWGRDTERAVRRLLRAPLFTISMVATLTVGLGAFATVFAVVQKVLLAPLPYERSEDLYFVWRDYSTVFDLNRGWLAGTDVAALQGAGGAIVDAAGFSRSLRTLASATASGSDASPEEVPVLVTTPNIFQLLGVQPAIGRGFTAEEVGPDRPQVIVLGHELWQRRFGGDRSIVGTDVLLNGLSFTVIGVMGPEFRFLRPSGTGAPVPVDAYVTHAVHLADTSPGDGEYAGLVRARPGTLPEAVDAAVAVTGRAVDERDHGGRGIRLYPVGLKSDLFAGVRQPLLVLGAAAVLLVLVLAVNMATLLLVRAAQRDREFAISRALGANRVALLRATLLEAGLLGMLGGAGGALAAVWGTRLLVSLAPLDIPRRETIAVDWPIAGIVVAVGMLLGLMAGIVPAVWSAKSELATVLRNAAVRGGGAHGPVRRGMVVVQVALSLVLLSTGGLVVRSFDRLLRADPGFESSGVLSLRIPVPFSRYPNDTVANALQERLMTELSAIPAVESVGAATTLPLRGGASQTTVLFPGAPGNTGVEEQDAPLVDYMMVRGDFFETLQIRVLAGRVFTAQGASGAREAVIDRTLAARFFPDGQAVGSTMVFRGDTLTIAGVVDHARLYDVHQDGRVQAYFRNEDYTYHTLSYALRSGRSPESLVPEVRAAVQRIDPQLALADVRSMDEVVREALQQPRLSAVLLSGFSLGALLLAAMGLYGVIAGAVNHRRHELAVRLALGADHARVLRLVLSEGARLIALGLLIGIPGIYVAGRVIGSLLVGVSPFDPSTLGAVALGLGLVATVACYIPARRVAAIAPAQSLREG